MTEQTLKEKTAKGLFWGGVSSGAQQILSFIFGIILARVLNPADYGIVGVLAIFTMIASTIQDSGFSVALINKKDFVDDDYNAVFWFNIVVGLIIYLILFTLAPLISNFYEIPELCSLSRFLFLGCLFSGMGIAQNAVLSKKLMIKEKTKVDILSLFISGVIGIGMALSGFGYWGLAVQSVVYVLVGTVLKWYYSPWKPTLNFNLYPLKVMFRFSITLFFTNIISQISNNIFSVLLGKLYNVKLVGYYSQGYKWMVMGHGFVGNIMNSVSHPVLAQIQNDIAYQKKVFRKMVRFGAFLSFPLLWGLAFVANEFVCVTVGDKWLPSVPFLQLFCLWGGFAYLWNLYINLLYTQGKSNIYMFGIILVSVMQLVVLGTFASHGVYIMLCMYLLIYFVGLFIGHFYIRKIADISFKEIVCDIAPYLTVALFSFFIAWLLTICVDNVYLLLMLKILISVIVYTTILWLCKSVILKESVMFILDKWRKC